MKNTGARNINILVSPGLQELRQEDQEIKSILGHIVRQK